MKRDSNRRQSSERPRPRRLLPWIGVITLGIVLLAAMPGAWALPSQLPDYQTVPTLTPTSPPPGSNPTNTPRPAEPTDTPAPLGPTNTPAPAQPTATPTAAAQVTATATPTRLAAGSAPVLPANCLAVPTPGFSAQPLAGIGFAVESDQVLVVPGQQVTLRYIVTNNGDDELAGVLVCAPLDATLERGDVTATAGQARLAEDGLIFELDSLAPGEVVTTEVTLALPADAPLGSVIENQAWLFTGGQQASTNLLTWALPPAYLPPTGRFSLSCAE